jgi:two-component system chemotaxis sensor kinase CheA
VPLARLEHLLGLPLPTLNTNRLLVIIIVAGKERLGLVVEDLNGEQEIVIKGLGKQLRKVKGLAGATILGSGEALLVLHPPDLIRLGRQVMKQNSGLSLNQTQSNADNTPKRVMVVDDSITTRTLEQNILEGAGYAVTLANNGQDALNLLENTPQQKLPHLFILDVNMPGLNGFELTARLKQDPRYQHLPVVLVTSRNSAEDKAKGIQVEADAFIVKSDFNQTNLLETIIQLI